MWPVRTLAVAVGQVHLGRTFAGTGLAGSPLHSTSSPPALPLSVATGTEIVADRISNYRMSPNTMASIQVLSDYPEVALATVEGSPLPP